MLQRTLQGDGFLSLSFFASASRNSTCHHDGDVCACVCACVCVCARASVRMCACQRRISADARTNCCKMYTFLCVSSSCSRSWSNLDRTPCCTARNRGCPRCLDPFTRFRPCVCAHKSHQRSKIVYYTHTHTRTHTHTHTGKHKATRHERRAHPARMRSHSPHSALMYASDSWNGTRKGVQVKTACIEAVQRSCLFESTFWF